jgi:hypothetical protein
MSVLTNEFLKSKFIYDYESGRLLRIKLLKPAGSIIWDVIKY